ncbi:MAG TPA: ATP-binding protein [Vicinamibacteria bacterium]
MRLAHRLSAAALPAALGAILLLLGLLATLQYRWAGALSEAERVRLSASARARAEALSREFDIEITRAWSGLQMSAETLRARDFAAYAERHQAWLRAAAHPALVREVFLLEAEEEGPARLGRFDPAQRTFVDSEWPPALEPARARAEEALHPPPGRGGFRGRSDFPAGAVPALFVPVFDRPPPGEWPRERRPPGPPPQDGPRFRAPALVILLLDPERVLPALAERHFGGAGGLDYDLTVVRQHDRGAVVWRSRPGARTGPPDAQAGLLDLRFEELGGREGPGREGPGREGLPGREGPGFGGPPRAHTPDSGAWRLLVARREGPLDQVVAAARRRNLAVSFGILLLLAASVALVVASSQRARRLGQQQLEFVAAVSHELRTPVAVICSTAENLADGVVSEPGQVRRYGAIVRDEGRRLGDMVEQVLQFAGASAARNGLQRQPVEAARLIEQALEPFAAALAERGFTVITEAAPGLPPLHGDPAVLRRALQNLVENALKYDAGGRWLALRAEAAGGGELRITVEDHGRGIEPADLPHVFEPFYRGREPQEEQIHGVGLGLALVRRAVEAHGGRVSVASAPGRGSTFTLRLPAAARPAATVTEPRPALTHPHR